MQAQSISLDPKTIPEQQLRSLYLSAGSIPKLAKMMGLSSTRVLRKRIAASNIELNARCRSALYAYSNGELTRALQKHGTVTGAARELKVSPSTLRSELAYRKIDLQSLPRNLRTCRDKPTNLAIQGILRGNKPLHTAHLQIALAEKGIHIQRSSVLHCIQNERKHSDSNVFYIAGWKRIPTEPGRAGPLWALGPGEDVPRPKPRSLKEQRRQAYIRQKQRTAVRTRAKRRKGPIPVFYYLLSMAGALQRTRPSFGAAVQRHIASDSGAMVTA